MPKPEPGLLKDVLFWILIALLTAAAIMAVLLPLGRAPEQADRDEQARRVYSDQLEELERDRADGRISAAEAEAARAEIARRLIASQGALGEKHEHRSSLAPRRAVSVLALAGIPLIAVSLYLGLGSPSLPGQPLAARLAEPPAPDDIQALVAKVEQHLARSPEDGAGWDVIAPVYLRMGRAAEAADAYRNAIRLLGSTAARQNGLGEAIFAAAGGIVTAEARAAFEAANAADPTARGPRFYLGLAAEQAGNREEAESRWEALLAEAPPDAPWRPVVEQALARLAPSGAGTPPSINGANPAAASAVAAMGPAEQAAMIDGMVSGLAERLQREPQDVEGWLRLIRSYVVLGRTEDAALAARDALAQLSQTDSRRRVEALIADLGLAPAELGPQ